MKSLNHGFIVIRLKSSRPEYYGHHHDLINSYIISFTNENGFVQIALIIIRFFIIPRLIAGFATTVTRRVPLVE